jgi:hypothetical protein
MDQKTTVILSLVGVVILVLALSCGCFMAPRAVLLHSGSPVDETSRCKDLETELIRLKTQETLTSVEINRTNDVNELQNLNNKADEISKKIADIQAEMSVLPCQGAQVTVKPHLEEQSGPLHKPAAKIYQVKAAATEVNDIEGINPNSQTQLHEIRDRRTDLTRTTSTDYMRNPMAGAGLQYQPSNDRILNGPSTGCGLDKLAQTAGPMYGSHLSVESNKNKRKNSGFGAGALYKSGVSRSSTHTIKDTF